MVLLVSLRLQTSLTEDQRAHRPRDPQGDVQHYGLLAYASAENTSWTKSP
jgi:hypothetical protein